MNERLLGLEQDWGLDLNVGYGLGVTSDEGVFYTRLDETWV